jgi:hypothetical protein
MSLQEKVANLVSYGHSLTDFVTVETEEGDYGHMGATITDAMLQPTMPYEATVQPRVQRLLEQHPEARTTSGFLRLLVDVGPNELLEWGGEEPKRILGVTRFFVEENIETEADLREWFQKPNRSTRLKQQKGIADKTADYFKILVGIPTSAVDTHLFSFLEAAGIEVSGYEEAQQVINETADLMDLDRRRFDYSIWKYMSARKAKPCRD